MWRRGTKCDIYPTLGSPLDSPLGSLKLEPVRQSSKPEPWKLLLHDSDEPIAAKRWPIGPSKDIELRATTAINMLYSKSAMPLLFFLILPSFNIPLSPFICRP